MSETAVILNGETDWIEVDNNKPLDIEEGTKVLYYFEVTGISYGQHLGTAGDDGGDHVFGSRLGFLTGDVTHYRIVKEPNNENS